MGFHQFLSNKATFSDLACSPSPLASRQAALKLVQLPVKVVQNGVIYIQRTNIQFSLGSFLFLSAGKDALGVNICSNQVLSLIERGFMRIYFLPSVLAELDSTFWLIKAALL